MSYCASSFGSVELFEFLVASAAALRRDESVTRRGTRPLRVEQRVTAAMAVLVDGLSYRKAARYVGMSTTEVGEHNQTILWNAKHHEVRVLPCRHRSATCCGPIGARPGRGRRRRHDACGLTEVFADTRAAVLADRGYRELATDAAHDMWFPTGNKTSQANLPADLRSKGVPKYSADHRIIGFLHLRDAPAVTASTMPTSTIE